MTDFLNTVVPIILILIGIVWAWSVFQEPIKRFYEWIKGLMGSANARERFQAPVNAVKEFTYS